MKPNDPTGTDSVWRYVSEVVLSVPSSWENRILVTLDIDWAVDLVLEDAIDLVESLDLRATWYVTHDTPLLARLRASDRHELGIHPNFNPLLFRNDHQFGSTPNEIVSRLLEIVPAARSVRSHSMTQSSWLLALFRERGLTHDTNTYMPAVSEVALRPWTDWNGLIRVPYFWEDDLHAAESPHWRPEIYVSRPGLRVFDFHPIHLFLNTPAPDLYGAARPHLHDAATLEKMRHKGIGPRSFLRALAHSAKVAQ